ncbi:MULTISPECIES: 1,2-phenylacetyl-CoA epoxidase subunit PaaC [Pontibacillus]|uniref:Phenylacetate-CoA oxygenase subunit PaaC n=1 Tax=Pontibacillus chungwhensis TaxID=265426 RepID=A0ABY8V8T1_9BACI|nr:MULTISPECIES: 1,2-phenylacetyl-CoA epoxidase subunit PaaC [Pontibacillus]MCD5323479.1 phenylacetate-CoA oxygenase subunit PaaC [Pontibacillus sp. HN14]WIG00212.1 phenylacetate-CoA oxygenase subunit PaaC [Pontibacillus chungwhensis]
MKTLEDVKANGHEEALRELLFQLADDDFIVAYRGSEWLGLAPHIEEDVAFSSISQDTMGHATMYYQLLEDLDAGIANDLAHGRMPEERRNAILLEEVNGPGHYLEEPRYDWAFAVVRHYFYTQAKKIRTDSLQQSSYEPLSHVAIKVNTELYYHLMHWKTWFKQLITIPGEAQERMLEAVSKVLEDMDGVLTLGPQAEQMAQAGLIEGEALLRKRWMNEIESMMDSCNIQVNLEPQMKRGDGRALTHTEDLNTAIETLSAVYRQDPAAIW